jgi:monoamine oxidase
LTQGAKIHPQYRNAFESAFSVAWHKVPYSLGAWAFYTQDARENVYPRLLAFDDRIHLAGDHMSHLAGWMEGAVLSAQGVTKTIHEQVQRQR